MKREAIQHIPMSQDAHAINDTSVVFRLRAARNDLIFCRLFYGDRACRQTPVNFTVIDMTLVAQDAQFDYFEVCFKTPYRRLCYYFQLDDGTELLLYYAGLFAIQTVDDRSEYYQFPFLHREDTAVVPDWVHDAVVYNIFPDSFATGKRFISNKATEYTYSGQPVQGKLGGTIKGISENADYLRELGINCIYINPIFAAGAYHKYDLLDYFSVDPCFGTNADFAEMVKVLHQNGIRVIIDAVFNHCGWYFFAFDDVVRNGENSKYKNWFYRLEFPIIRPDNMEDIPNYECFAYERLMPKLDTANPEVIDYFLKVCAYWLKEYGIDGWRLDVADEVDDNFWRQFRKTAKTVNPDAVLIGEIWGNAAHWLDGSQFDSSMNYDLRKHSRRFFGVSSIDAFDFDGRVTQMRMRYRKNMLPAQLNLLDSHDVSRFLSLCGNDIQRMKLAVLFQMCFIGMPSVFYGDEQGISGLSEDEYRSPMCWDGDSELFEFYKQAIKLRKEHIALRRGDFRTLTAESGTYLYVFERFTPDEQIVIAINISSSPAFWAMPNGKILWQYGYHNGQLDAFGFMVIKVGAKD